MADSFYITTPIYYVNDSPHIGHAYTTIACDVAARYHRLAGEDVYFLTGTDEHGQKVAKSAAAKGVHPQAFTDEVSARFHRLVQSGEGENLLNISNDDFIRTTDTRHKEACQALWREIAASQTPKGNSCIYKDTYGGWYAVRDEAYYAESELTLRDGRKLAPSGAEVEWVEEESYFFRLSDYQEALLAHYAAQPDFVQPDSRLNEVKSFVAGGLKDLSISRTTFDWGVKVPGDEAHVMYVWLDALNNYITALGYPAKDGRMAKFWQGKAVHVVGKDILRFHAVYWPAFLMAASLFLPGKVIAHGWWTIEGEKMSKSVGNVLSPDAMLATAGSVDALRFFMLRAMPFGNDGDFSQDRMVEVINAELANNIGNLAQRTLSMIAKNCGGILPAAQFQPVDRSLLSKATDLTGKYHQYMRDFAYQNALIAVTTLAGEANEYIDSEAPWKLKKDDPERMGAVLYVLAEIVRQAAIMLQPFCPQAAAKLLGQLGLPEDQPFSSLAHPLKASTAFPAPEGVFPRLESLLQEAIA